MTTRRSFMKIVASTASVVVAAPVLAKAPGFLRGAGDIRKIRFRNFMHNLTACKHEKQ